MEPQEAGGEQEVLTPAEAAERTKASLTQVYRWAAEPGCPVFRLGKQKGVRFLWPQLLQWLEERTRLQKMGLQLRPIRAKAATANNGQPRRRGRPTKYEQLMRDRRWTG